MNNFMDLVMEMKSDLEESGDHKHIDRIKQAMEKEFLKTKKCTDLQFKPTCESSQVNKIKRKADQQMRPKSISFSREKTSQEKAI